MDHEQGLCFADSSVVMFICLGDIYGERDNECYAGSNGLYADNLPLTLVFSAALTRHARDR